MGVEMAMHGSQVMVEFNQDNTYDIKSKGLLDEVKINGIPIPPAVKAEYGNRRIIKLDPKNPYDPLFVKALRLNCQLRGFTFQKAEDRTKIQ